MATIPFPTSAGFLKRPKICTLGDSYSDGGASALGRVIDHARFWHYPADIDWNPTDSTNYSFGVGGTKADYMLSTELPLAQAAGGDISLIWSSGFNEGASISASVTAAMNNVYTPIIGTAEGLLAAGFSNVVIFPVMPTANINAIPVNLRLASYAAQTSGVIFFDCTKYLIDAASTASPRAWLGGSGQVGAATYDGTHVSPNACRLIASDFSDILAQLTRPHMLRQAWHGSGFSPQSIDQYANVLGTAGAFEGDSGGLATGWTQQGSVSGVTFTPSKTTNADTGAPQQKITISGTPAASGQISLRVQTPFASGVGNALFAFEMMAQLVAVEGLAGISFGGTNAGVSGYTNGSDASYRSAVWADLNSSTPIAVTQDVPLYSTYGKTISSGGQENCNLTFDFANGVEVSGEIYLEFAGVYQVDPIS